MKKLLIVLSVVTMSAWANPGDVLVTFTNRTDTAIGQQLFVLGSIPQLGGWVRNQAIKMVPSNCSGSTCDWTVTIAIPPGTSYEYKFVKRYDCACCWDNPNISCYGRTDDASIVYESGPNRTGSTPAFPPAPCPGKTVFYFTGWASPSILFSNTTTAAFELRALQPVSNGVWRVDGLNRAGEKNLTFVFTDNNGNFDNPSGPGTNYETPLDACVVKDGQIYNYWPPSFVSTNRVEVFWITPSNGLQSRYVRVYLPRGYNENSAKYYPVLYMQDGQNLFLNSGPCFGCASWNVDTNVNNLIRFGKMREIIVVGVDNGDRQCEYTPCWLGPTICSSGATAEKYAAFLINDVKTYIDANYRTLLGAENTGVMGSSRGGLISVFLAWEHSDVFGKLGALSPSFWACSTTKDNLANGPKKPLRVYLDSGTVGDFPSSNPTCNPCYDGIVQTMTARDNLIYNGYRFNDDLDHTIGYGQNHNEYWWDRRSPRAFTFLFPTRDEPNSVLDTYACPPQITAYTGTNITWASFRSRKYTLQGSTNVEFSSSMNWSNIVTTPPESLPWSYPVLSTPPDFRFLRIRQDNDPVWFN